MTNSVDPDQTAPSGAVWSGSALFAYVILSDTLVYKILGHLTYLPYFPINICTPYLLTTIVLKFVRDYLLVCLKLFDE